MSGPRSISSVTGAAGGEGGADGVVLEAELGQPHALGVGVDAHTVQGRHGVRARVATPAGASRRRTPSPTRGASSVRRSSPSNGNVPSAIMRAKRSKISM